MPGGGSRQLVLSETGLINLLQEKKKTAIWIFTAMHSTQMYNIYHMSDEYINK